MGRNFPEKMPRSPMLQCYLHYCTPQPCSAFLHIRKDFRTQYGNHTVDFSLLYNAAWQSYSRLFTAVQCCMILGFYKLSTLPTSCYQNRNHWVNVSKGCTQAMAFIWGDSWEKVHNVRSRKVEKTAIKVKTCHKYACKHITQKVPQLYNL